MIDELILKIGIGLFSPYTTLIAYKAYYTGISHIPKLRHPVMLVTVLWSWFILFNVYFFLIIPEWILFIVFAVMTFLYSDCAIRDHQYHMKMQNSINKHFDFLVHFKNLDNLKHELKIQEDYLNIEEHQYLLHLCHVLEKRAEWHRKIKILYFMT